MPSKSPRKQHGAEMRERIQKTALTLFDEHGFENVSKEDIAHTVGCSVGNIYHYFKSKDELSLKVTDFVDVRYEKLLEAYNQDTVTPAREKLLDFVGRSLEISIQDEMLYKAFAHGLRHPEQRTLRITKNRVWYQVLEKLISDGQKDGSISDKYMVDDLIRLFVILHRGVLFEWRIRERDFNLFEQGRHMASLMLKGMEE